MKPDAPSEIRGPFRPISTKAPGIQISMEALFRRAAKLPKIDIGRPSSVVGRSTVESMQSGIYYGYVALVDGLVRRVRAEMKAGAASP